MRRMRKNHGSKWEPGRVRRCNGGQVDQDEVLDDYFYVTSALRAFRFGSEGHVITVFSLRCELRQICRCRYECNLIKNLSIY